jgi:hypothetical protein
MGSELVQTGKSLMEGATFGGGLAWLATNSSAMTAIAVISTGIASMYFGYQRKKIDDRNAAANEERNRINERDITDGILSKLECDLSDEIMSKVKKSLRK